MGSFRSDLSEYCKVLTHKLFTIGLRRSSDGDQRFIKNPQKNLRNPRETGLPEAERMGAARSIVAKACPGSVPLEAALKAGRDCRGPDPAGLPHLRDAHAIQIQTEGERDRTKTNRVDVTRYAAGRYYDPFHRRGLEEIRGRAGNSIAMEDILARLVGIQGAEARNGVEPLAHLLHLRVSKYLGETWLAAQYDLDKFCRWRLEVRKHPDGFQRLLGQVLSFIEDNHTRLAEVMRAQQVLVEQPVILCRRAVVSRPNETRIDSRTVLRSKVGMR